MSGCTKRRIGVQLFLIGLLSFPSILVEAQVLQVDMDEASFAYGDGESLVEIYLAFDASGLRFTSVEDAMLSQLPVAYTLARSTSAELEGTPVDPVYADTSTISFIVADTTMLQEGQFFVHQFRTVVPPGEYEMTVDVLADSSTSRPHFALRRDVVVPDYASEGLAKLSGMALASSIQASQDRTSVFYKNGLDVRPNANQLFGGALSTLFYYVEAYNLTASLAGGEEYTVLSFVSEANQAAPIAGLQVRKKRTVRDPDVLVGSFDLSALPSGSYFVKVAVLDANNQSLVEQSRKFFVFNPDVERPPVIGAEVNFETSEFASMSVEEVERAFDLIGVIANNRERRRIKSIEDQAERRRFLYDFWDKRDPNPATRENEFRDEYYRRVQFAEERYSSSIGQGWRSDRGHIILRYGMPSAVDPHMYDRGVAPYEVWQYNNIQGQGQAVFIFADTQGFGEFEQVHSTVSGEPQSPNWLSELTSR